MKNYLLMDQLKEYSKTSSKTQLKKNMPHLFLYNVYNMTLQNTGYSIKDLKEYLLNLNYEETKNNQQKSFLAFYWKGFEKTENGKKRPIPVISKHKIKLDLGKDKGGVQKVAAPMSMFILNDKEAKFIHQPDATKDAYDWELQMRKRLALFKEPERAKQYEESFNHKKKQKPKMKKKDKKKLNKRKQRKEK